jgi:hypothetical protein
MKYGVAAGSRNQLDIAAVQLQDAANDHEIQTATALAARRERGPREKDRLEFPRHAGSGVADFHPHSGTFGHQAHHDLAALRCMADRVIEQVGQDPFDHPKIGRDGGQARGNLGHEPLTARTAS